MSLSFTLIDYLLSGRASVECVEDCLDRHEPNVVLDELATRAGEVYSLSEYTRFLEEVCLLNEYMWTLPTENSCGLLWQALRCAKMKSL